MLPPAEGAGHQSQELDSELRGGRQLAPGSARRTLQGSSRFRSPPRPVPTFPRVHVAPAMEGAGGTWTLGKASIVCISLRITPCTRGWVGQSDTAT